VRRHPRTIKLALAVATCLLLALGGFAFGALSTDNVRETSVSEGTSILGLRPTGVGLPEVGVHGTVGAGDYADPLKEYHDSGQYEADLAAVGQRAQAYVTQRSRRLRAKARKRCRRAREQELDPEVIEQRCEKPRLAIVFDIDETSLSNYEELAAADFKEATLALLTSAAQADAPAIEPTKRVYETALQKGLAVFFITGRPESIPQARERTAQNLAAAGYTEYEQLILNDTGQETIPYKSGKRAGIEAEGYDIVANLGDQESDLAGGHADRAFKLPHPFYFIG
jgi:predicted secreted acid phosphatase